MTTLTALLPEPGRPSPDADALYDLFTTWASERGTPLYPHQDEAVIELLSGNHCILATPTGSGKSLVATAAQFAALAQDKVSFYTAPIKALVSEKFFALCEVFGAENVGMLTGDASVNADAPIIACTAEVLANIALREGADADVGLVVMDEFHYYSEPQRGWAWQVPLLELPHAQFLLMSATLGDVTRFVDDLEGRTGIPVSVVDKAERPVPLEFEWSMTQQDERLAKLVETDRAPVYIVHSTQKEAADHAVALQQHRYLSKDEQSAMLARLAGFRFTTGFGKTLSALLRKGIGVHHAGMLPRYRRLVEQLAQSGMLKVICGTDTLGVGINVPIRTVMFTGLTKFDGSRHRVLRVREFLQIAGRAGRAGYDTRGYVVVQAPEHVIENEKLVAKAGDDPKKLRKVQRKKPPEGFVVWTEQTFEKLTTAPPEQLQSRMKIDDAMILNVVARPGDPVPVLSRLLRDNHEDARGRARLALRAISLTRSLLDSGVLVRLPEPDATGRTVALTVDLPRDFALNQPLAAFAVAALDTLDPDSPEHALDVVSVIEAVLDSPRPVLMAQQYAARGEAVAQMKADGIEYEERMLLLEDITWPQPLRELLEVTYESYRQTHPWLSPDGLTPKAIVRDMWATGMTFTEFVSRYQLARSEGVVLRYLTDAYRTLRHSVPEQHNSPELEEVVEWLGETVRQTDSSLLDEWEALANPDKDHDGRVDASEVAGAAATVSHHDDGPRPNRPITAREAVFRTMVRNAVWQRVERCARDDLDALAAAELGCAALTDPPRRPVMDRAAWDVALGDYWEEHDQIATDTAARGREHFHVETGRDVPPGLTGPGGRGTPDDAEEVRVWHVRQTLADPEGDHDWVIEATVDLDASDLVGEPVLLCTALRRL